MKIPRPILLAVCATLFGAALATGISAAVTVGATGSSTTYFACLKAGRLTGVGTASPTCRSGATVISWNSQGPTGATATNTNVSSNDPAGSSSTETLCNPGCEYTPIVTTAPVSVSQTSRFLITGEVTAALLTTGADTGCTTYSGIPLYLQAFVDTTPVNLPTFEYVPTTVESNNTNNTNTTAGAPTSLTISTIASVAPGTHTFTLELGGLNGCPITGSPGEVDAIELS